MSRANWPIGYHWSNEWRGQDYEPFAKALKRAGMNIAGLECFDWFEVQPCDCKKTGGSSRYGGCNTKGHWRDAQRFVATMAAREIATVVTFENRNSCACRRKDDDWRRRQYAKALKLGEFGAIWIIPSSEPWAGSDNAAFVRWARSATPAHVPFVIPSRRKDRLEAYYPGIAASFLDIHPCSMAEADRALRLGPSALVQTDCTGTLDPGPANAAKLARLSAQTKTPLLIYRFEGAPRLDTIEAMGREIKAAMG